MAHGRFSRARAGHPQGIRRMFAATPVAGYVGCCEALSQLDQRDLLPKISPAGPDHRGPHDMSTTVEQAEFMRKAIPKAEHDPARRGAPVQRRAELRIQRRADRVSDAAVGRCAPTAARDQRAAAQPAGRREVGGATGRNGSNAALTASMIRRARRLVRFAKRQAYRPELRDVGEQVRLGDAARDIDRAKIDVLPAACIEDAPHRSPSANANWPGAGRACATKAGTARRARPAAIMNGFSAGLRQATNVSMRHAVQRGGCWRTPRRDRRRTSRRSARSPHRNCRLRRHGSAHPPERRSRT